jgi:hypothetical protein
MRRTFKEESDMSESSSPIAAAGRSGDSVRQVGPYRSNARIPLVVFFKSGDRLPADAEGRQVTWTLLSDERQSSAEPQS